MISQLHTPGELSSMDPVLGVSAQNDFIIERFHPEDPPMNYLDIIEIDQPELEDAYLEELNLLIKNNGNPVIIEN